MEQRRSRRQFAEKYTASALDHTQCLEFCYFIIKDYILGRMQSRNVPLQVLSSERWHVFHVILGIPHTLPVLLKYSNVKKHRKWEGSSPLWKYYPIALQIGEYHFHHRHQSEPYPPAHALSLIVFIWCSIGGSLWQMDHCSTGMTSWWFTGSFLFLRSVVFVSTGLDKFPKALAINITYLIHHNLHNLCVHHTEHLAGGNSCWFLFLVFETKLFKQHFCHRVEVPLLDLTDVGHFLSWDRRVPKNHIVLHSELASPVWLKHFVSFSSGICEGEG